MKDSDKALLNSIWNMAGFPSDQIEQNPEVARKFLGILKKVGPKVLRTVIPHIGKIPGFPERIKPVLPYLANLIPQRMIDMTGIKHKNNNNRQHTGTGRSDADSPTTINYKGPRKPFNSELNSSEEDNLPEVNSNRRALHLKNEDLELFDDNNQETNTIYDLSENLETSPEDLEAVTLALEQLKRMMQDVGDNKKSWNFLQNMNVGEQSHDTTKELDILSRSLKNHSPFDVMHIGSYHEEVDLQNKNSHMDYMHQKEYKTDNTTRNSDTSSLDPIGVCHKCAKKRKESSRTSETSPETSKNYEMLQNNQKIHNVEEHTMMHQNPDEPRTYLLQQ
ncbi:hypothetical protein CBL_04391 [Carabus blaptoides fortunei]